MATEFKVEEVQAALLTLLATGVPAVTVCGVSSDQIDQDGNVVLGAPPIIGLLYETTTDEPSRDRRGTIYATTHLFLALCFARNLRSASEQDVDAQKLVSLARAAVAGKVLTLDSGDTTEPARLGGVERLQSDANGSWYAVSIAVSDTAQF